MVSNLRLLSLQYQLILSVQPIYLSHCAIFIMLSIPNLHFKIWHPTKVVISNRSSAIGLVMASTNIVMVEQFLEEKLKKKI